MTFLSIVPEDGVLIVPKRVGPSQNFLTIFYLNVRVEVGLFVYNIVSLDVRYCILILW